jgi:hypothetical protein
MFTINVEKECGCFKKSDFKNGISFESKDDALIEAKKMTDYMNEEFCQKHEFVFSENGQDFNIAVFDQPKKESGGCCGGGHCS